MTHPASSVETNALPDAFVETRKSSPIRLPFRALLILINLVVALELPLMLKMINVSDYVFHTEAAWAIAQGAEVDFPHRLYHYLTIAIEALLPGDNFKAAAIFATILAYLVLAVAMSASFYRHLRGRHPWMAIGLTMAMLLTGPILIFDLGSNPATDLSFAYIQFTYHNPTTTLMRALAVIVFLYAAAALLPPRVSWGHVIGGGVFTFLLSNAKPNYNLPFLPAAGLILIYRTLRRLFVDYPMLLTILGVMVLTLAAQYLTTFNTGGASTGVGIQPFGFLMSIRHFSLLEIVGKHALSMAMPLAVLVLYSREVRHDPLLGLAWLTFLFGLFIELCVVELGDRLAHGNFYWTGEVTLFVLFFATVHVWIRAMGGRLDFKSMRARVIWGLWGLHLMGGVLWYWLHLTS